MRIRRRLAAVACAGALAATGVVVNATTAQAATCYGGAFKTEKDSGEVQLPSAGFYVTSTRCADINLKVNYSRNVRVCFYKSTGYLNYCQTSYTYAKSGQWNTVATDVKDGVRYRFNFQTVGSGIFTVAH
ncbi:hypothetical protein ACIBI4_08680 [Streptomyces sp. NPDC050418]|uniref:hypothetical protein n=1 Tax=Streptomyces sp. NPDC050418 TaxID=3365612 RepID=UPI003797886E